MANHLEEQRSPQTCKLLVAELERVIDEEVKQREKLIQDGVRDVSEYISLPPNRVDQLDEDSALYDDKRLCHACKHICFFSCVACECSKSKVSCLRHSHFMCRCPAKKRYMMIWSTKANMEDTLSKVKSHLQELEDNYIDLTDENDNDEDLTDENDNDETKHSSEKDIPSLAPGADKDEANHRGFTIDVTSTSPLFTLPVTGQRLLFEQNHGTEQKTH